MHNSATTIMHLTSWVQVSIRVLCSATWTLACFMQAGERSAVVAVQFGSDSVLCVDGAWMLSIPPVLQGFYSLPVVLFLALLLELHIIEVFVLCGHLWRASSILGKSSVAAPAAAVLLHVGWHEFIGPPTLIPLKALSIVSLVPLLFVEIRLKSPTFPDMTHSLWHSIRKDWRSFFRCSLCTNFVIDEVW